MPGNYRLIWNDDFPSLLSSHSFPCYDSEYLLNLNMPCVCCKWTLHFLRSQVGLHFNDNLIYTPFSSATLHKSWWFTPWWLAPLLSFTKDICHMILIQAVYLEKGHTIHQLNILVYKVKYTFNIQSHIHTNLFSNTIYSREIALGVLWHYGFEKPSLFNGSSNL